MTNQEELARFVGDIVAVGDPAGLGVIADYLEEHDHPAAVQLRTWLTIRGRVLAAYNYGLRTALTFKPDTVDEPAGSYQIFPTTLPAYDPAPTWAQVTRAIGNVPAVWLAPARAALCGASLPAGGADGVSSSFIMACELRNCVGDAVPLTTKLQTTTVVPDLAACVVALVATGDAAWSVISRAVAALASLSRYLQGNALPLGGCVVHGIIPRQLRIRGAIICALSQATTLPTRNPVFASPDFSNEVAG